MSGTKRVLMVLAVLVAMMGGRADTAAAQIATTTVSDTIYSANGTPASGTVLVSWNSFTAAGGQTVAAGNTSVTLGAGGLLSIALTPNAGATPMGSYYTAIFHLSDGTTSRQYWVVPASVPGGAPATLAEIKSEVLPISVAMQTVSKQYVDNAIAAAVTGSPSGSSPYVQKAGDTMTGPLVLAADPVSPSQAADKNYVDENLAATGAGLGQKVSLLPSASQAVAQPSGTTFSVNGVTATTTFSGSGVNSQNTITSGNTAANPRAGDYSLLTNQSNCYRDAVLAYIESNEHYPKIYFQGREAGWLTSAVSKPEMTARLGSLLQQRPEMFRSRRLLSECRTFVGRERGKTGAANGAHDDLVMAMAVGQAVRAEMFREGSRGFRTNAVR